MVRVQWWSAQCALGSHSVGILGFGHWLDPITPHPSTLLCYTQHLVVETAVLCCLGRDLGQLARDLV